MPKNECDPLNRLPGGPFGSDDVENINPVMIPAPTPGKHAMMPDEIKTPEDLAREIIDFPNLWGMYSIADVIHRLINEAKQK